MSPWLPGRVKRSALVWVLLTSMLVLSGCASRGALFDQVDRELERGRTEQALAALEPLAASGRNQALYLLNRGMLLRMAGDLQGSIAHFEQAKQVIGRLQPISLTESLAAWSVAEDSGSYSPAMYEHLLLHVYQGLNFLELGRLQEARVEALQIDRGLRRIDPVNHRAPRGGDAFARYLSGLIFEANRDWSDALISYRKAYESYRRNAQPVPADLQRSLLRLTDYLGLADERDSLAQTFGIDQWASLEPDSENATVLFVVHDGFAPRLREESSMVAHPTQARIIRVSLPALEERPTGLARIRVVTNASQTDGEQVENVANSASEWLAAQMPGLLGRAVTRNVARNELTRNVEKESELLGAVLNVVGALLENADTRTWRTLPDRLYLARVQVPPGETRLRLELLDAGGRVIGSLERRVALAPRAVVTISGHWLGTQLLPVGSGQGL